MAIDEGLPEDGGAVLTMNEAIKMAMGVEVEELEGDQEGADSGVDEEGEGADDQGGQDDEGDQGLTAAEVHAGLVRFAAWFDRKTDSVRHGETLLQLAYVAQRIQILERKQTYITSFFQPSASEAAQANNGTPMDVETDNTTAV